MEFAELEDFVDLKLKNYSSGMMVRLAFAVMVQADADIMLIDEVLAVGDAAFAQKCMDVFHEKREAGKTIVLVTHDMATVQTLCHRAMVLHDGELRLHRRPRGGRAALLPAELRRPARRRRRGRRRCRTSTRASSTRGSRTRTASASRTSSRASRSASTCWLEARRELIAPDLRASTSRNADGVPVFGFSARARRAAASAPPGERVRLSGRIENPLLPGPLLVDCWIGARPHAAATSPSRACGCSTSWSTAPPGARAWSPCDADVEAVLERERRELELREVPRPVRARRRLAALARPADLIAASPTSSDLLRHRARLPVVDRAAADAVRRPAGRLHAGLPDRRRGAELSGAAAVQHRPVRLLPGGDAHRRAVDRQRRSRWCARRSSRAW